MLFGIGLRHHHFADLTSGKFSIPPVLEILLDNLIHHRGGPALHHTDLCAQNSKMVLHGVGLNIGGDSPISVAYLNEIKFLIKRYNPLVVSDHLCFTNTKTHHSYELLPLSRTKNELLKIKERIDFVQEYLNSQICLENVSAYVDYNNNEMSEGEFFTELTQKTGCGVLFDVNNIFVNAFNFSRNVQNEINEFPLQSIKQIHIAGHTICDDYLFDTHDQPVRKEVLDLTKNLLAKLNSKNIPIILEQDDSKLPLEKLLQEWAQVKQDVE